MNARDYDREIGQFIGGPLGADTLVPDPSNLFDYNRYLYARGNPMKYNDPMGHCATLKDGSPDRENDGGCWEAANEWLATFGKVGFASTEDWQKFFAGDASITEEILRAGLYAYWAPKFRESGVYHTHYNPPPQMHPVTNQDQAFEQFYAKYAPNNVTLDPKALGIATLKAGTAIGPMWKTGGMAACATGVACPAGTAFIVAGQVYEVVGYTTLAVNDIIIPVWNGDYSDAAWNAGTEAALAVTESKVSEPIRPYVPWIGVAIDVSGGVCVGNDC